MGNEYEMRKTTTKIYNLISRTLFFCQEKNISLRNLEEDRKLLLDFSDLLRSP